jgi:hypothetical protein
MAAAAAGLVLRIQKAILEKLQKAGATKQNPKTAEEAGITPNEAKWIWGLIIQGKVQELTCDNGKKKYYLPGEA